MKKMSVLIFAIFAVCVGYTASVTAADPRSPDIIIKGLTDELVTTIKERDDDTAQADFYRVAVENTLGPFIDFRSISRRVMAKHYKTASKEQRKRFSDSFRESLLNTYANGLAGLTDQEVKVLPFRGIKKKGKKERAKVDMEIHTSDGNVFPITYAIYKNKVGDWKLENIILNGVNLGLTFRNQFNESHRVNDGDIDKVIDAWNVKLVKIDLKGDKQNK